MKINTKKFIRKHTRKNIKDKTRRKRGRATRSRTAIKTRKRKMTGGVIFTKEEMNFKNAFRAEFMKAFEILKKDPNEGVAEIGRAHV